MSRTKGSVLTIDNPVWLAGLCGLLLLVGCGTGPNPLQGRQDEFDRRLAASDRTPAWAYNNCLNYQRQYFQVLNDARTGEATLTDLRAFERAYDEELRKVER